MPSSEGTNSDSDFEVAIASGDQRIALTALRNLLAHELAGNRCDRCRMSQMRTGDLAALALRLEKVMDSIAALPPEGQGVNKLEAIRGQRDSGPSAPTDLSSARDARARRQGGRHTSGTRPAGA